ANGREALLPPAVAVAALDAADSAAREGADPQGAMSRGHPRCHRRVEPGTPGLGQLLQDRERGAPLQQPRWLRLAAAPIVACEAQGSPAAGRRGEEVDPRVLLEPWAPSPARHCPVPGDPILGQSVMLLLEGPPVSRVREIRTHGLKGGLAL